MISEVSFQNCCLQIAAEIFRYVNQITCVSYEDIMNEFPCDRLEMALVIDLCINSFGNAMTKGMLVRIIEIQERAIEYEIWNSSDLTMQILIGSLDMDSRRECPILI